MPLGSLPPAKAKNVRGKILGRGRVAGGIERFTRGLGPTLLFGLVAHVGVAVIGMLAIPFYLSLMGAEAYGLVGFYLILQGWMLLFDLGLGPAVGRQLSRYRAGALNADEAASLFGTAETIFLIGGLIAGIAFYFSMGWIARHWLGSSRLRADQVKIALQLAGCLLVLRWLAGVYQTALVGLERQIAVNAVALVGAIARNGGAVVALTMVSHSPTMFFGVWAAVTLMEAVANRLLLLREMPRNRIQWRRGWRLLTREFSFAAGLTFSAAVYFTIGAADKATLSHTLPLSAFGIFTLVVSICAGITVVVPPMVQSFQPRLTWLLAQNKRAEFVEVYRLSISLIIVVVAGLAGTIAARPELVVYAWTGNREIARSLGPTLTFFAIGSGIASFLYLPYVLQFSQGLVRLHLLGNLLFGAIWVPAAIWAALTFGTVGAGIVWLCGNLLYLLLWVPVVHRRLLSPEERHGLGPQTWLRVALLAALLAATRMVATDTFDRPQSLAFLAATSASIMAVAAVSSRELRDHLMAIVRGSSASIR